MFLSWVRNSIFSVDKLYDIQKTIYMKQMPSSKFRTHWNAPCVIDPVDSALYGTLFWSKSNQFHKLSPRFFTIYFYIHLLLGRYVICLLRFSDQKVAKICCDKI